MHIVTVVSKYRVPEPLAHSSIFLGSGVIFFIILSSRVIFFFSLGLNSTTIYPCIWCISRKQVCTAKWNVRWLRLSPSFCQQHGHTCLVLKHDCMALEQMHNFLCLFIYQNDIKGLKYRVTVLSKWSFVWG